MVANAREGTRTDEALAASAAAGDQAAFALLADRYTRPAFAYAYHFLGGYDDAQDALQEALIAVHLKLPSARPELPFRPWFYAILRRKCLDALRRQPARRAPGDIADQPEEDELPDPAPLPDELYERKDLQRVLHEVIGELGPKYRDVVLLRYATELTFEEMGEVLRMPVNTVKTHFQRAKQRLRPLLLARQVAGAPRERTAKQGQRDS
jgi:RNA polymerase sigma-70 factor (ECF subfamily)